MLNATMNDPAAMASLARKQAEWQAKMAADHTNMLGASLPGNFQTGQIAAQTSATPQPELDSIHERLSLLANHLFETSHANSVMIERIFGPSVTGGEDPAVPQRTGALGSIYDALDGLDRIACDLRNQSASFRDL